MAPLVRELGERKLVQWALAYLAGAWLVIQVLDALADAWTIPVALLRGMQVLMALGLPLVLVLAWYHGEKGRQRVSGPELLMIAALLGIAAVVTGIWSRGGAATGSSGGTDAALARGPVRADGPSIAVLPFADMSPEGDQEYFADGMAEEILNALAKVPGLRVAARTSSFSFKGGDVDVRTVGERLAVAAVLEGSVRKEDDRLRITAQLVEVDEGFHIWSETFDRELESVFAIQEEIAREIVRALEVQLSGASPSTLTWPETTQPAYQSYLRGRHALNLFTPEGWDHAVQEFERAIDVDPSFAPAVAGLASAQLMRGFFGATPFTEVAPLAEARAEEALRLDGELAEAHAVMGLLALYERWDWEAAERELVRALELNPSDAFARHGYADLLMVLGDVEGGLRQVRIARQADPLSPSAAYPVIGHLMTVGRFEEALDEIEGLRELFPGRRDLSDPFRVSALWHLDRRDEALSLYRDLWPHDPDFVRAVDEAVARDGPEGALRAWGDAMATAYEARGGGNNEIAIASAYAKAGDADDAIAWVERAFGARIPWVLHVSADPDFADLRADPRLRDLMTRIGFTR